MLLRLKHARCRCLQARSELPLLVARPASLGTREATHQWLLAVTKHRCNGQDFDVPCHSHTELGSVN